MTDNTSPTVQPFSSVGVPRERKSCETRVALTPKLVRQLVDRGISVNVEESAGTRSGFSEHDYVEAGARIVDQSEAWASSLVVKVKEPLLEEYKFLRSDLTLFGFLHLAANPTLCQKLVDSGGTYIAFEQVSSPTGGFPILAPMSRIAGTVAVILGQRYLLSADNGPGLLPTFTPTTAAVVGCGVAGEAAIAQASSLGFNVVGFDISQTRCETLKTLYPQHLFLPPSALDDYLPGTHLLVGAAMSPGARAPIVVSSAQLRSLAFKAVAVDVAIDQGGCLEGSTPAAFTHPMRYTHGVARISIANLPATAARTATESLASALCSPLLQLVSAQDQFYSQDHLKRAVSVADHELLDSAVQSSLAAATPS